MNADARRVAAATNPVDKMHQELEIKNQFGGKDTVDGVAVPAGIHLMPPRALARKIAAYQENCIKSKDFFAAMVKITPLEQSNWGGEKVGMFGHRNPKEQQVFLLTKKAFLPQGGREVAIAVGESCIHGIPEFLTAPEVYEYCSNLEKIDLIVIAGYQDRLASDAEFRNKVFAHHEERSELVSSLLKAQTKIPRIGFMAPVQAEKVLPIEDDEFSVALLVVEGKDGQAWFATPRQLLEMIHSLKTDKDFSFLGSCTEVTAEQFRSLEVAPVAALEEVLLSHSVHDLTLFRDAQKMAHEGAFQDAYVRHLHKNWQKT